MRMLRMATRPAFDASMLQQMARNIFAEALEEMREEAESTASKAKQEAAGTETEMDASVVTFQIEDDMLLEGRTSSLAADAPAPLAGATGLADHIRCSGVLKKRRRKMRRHKHKKRLRKNRYKNKK